MRHILIGLGALLIGGAASAACVEGAIQRTQLSDGRWITVTGRDGDQISVEAEDPDGLLRQVFWQGLVPLRSDTGSSLHEWHWDQPLPDFRGLAKGEAVRLSGKKTFNGQPDVRVAWTVTSEGEAVNVIAGCDYPVLRLRVQESIDGRLRGEVAYDLHRDSLLVLNLSLKNLFTGEDLPDELIAVE